MTTITPTKEQQKLLAQRILAERTVKQRESLYEFLLYYWEQEKKTKLDENRHIKLICDKLWSKWLPKLGKEVLEQNPVVKDFIYHWWEIDDFTKLSADDNVF